MSIEKTDTNQKTKALSTGQAARYCFVTSDTILVWIKTKGLPAQKTAGGQHRVMVEDLRTFMRSHGMSTDLLDTEVANREHCWEFHNLKSKHRIATVESCETCPIFKGKVLNCFILRRQLPGVLCSQQDCRDCSYFKQWGFESQDP